MDSTSSPTTVGSAGIDKWWEATASVWACGVFEGGGAKGAAYGPALQAVADRGIWFTSVAGSSAGALTATLVAAGYKPSQIQAETETALKTFHVARPKRLRMYWWAASNLQDEPPHVRPSAPLQSMLEKLIRNQLPERGTPADVSFSELYQATGIELFVVTVNAATKREVIFNHHLTPIASVSQAATASSAIPVFFPAVIVPGHHLSRGSGIHAAALFDGGVWANFPRWIYESRSFWSYYEPELGKPPKRRTGTRKNPIVLGFLLDEDAEVTPTPTAAPSRPPTGPRGASAWAIIRQAAVRTAQIVINPARTAAELLGVISMTVVFTPFFLFALLVWVTASYSVVSCERFDQGCGVESAVADGLESVLGQVALFIMFGGLSFLMLKRLVEGDGRFSGFFLPKVLIAGRRIGSIFFGMYLLFSAAAMLQRGSKDFPRWLVEAQQNLVPLATLPLIVIGLAVATLASAIVLPAAFGLARSVGPLLASAGQVRFWEGFAPEDRIIRLPVSPLRTLDFEQAGPFLETRGEALRQHVIEQLRTRNVGKDG